MSSHVLLSSSASNSNCIAECQLGSLRAWFIVRGIGEIVVVVAVAAYCGFSLNIPTHALVTIGLGVAATSASGVRVEAMTRDVVVLGDGGVGVPDVDAGDAMVRFANGDAEAGIVDEGKAGTHGACWPCMACGGGGSIAGGWGERTESAETSQGTRDHRCRMVVSLSPRQNGREIMFCQSKHAMSCALSASTSCSSDILCDPMSNQ